MTVLVLASHTQDKLLTSTANTVSAALQISEDVHILITGFKERDILDKLAISASKLKGVTHVLVAQGALFQNNMVINLTQLILQLSQSYTHIITDCFSSYTDSLSRVAALLDIECLKNVCKIHSYNEFYSLAYNNRILAKIELDSDIKALNISPHHFQPVDTDSEASAMISDVQYNIINTTTCVNQQTTDLSIRLYTADIIIAGGARLGSKENFQKLFEIADNLGENVAIGATKKAVDAGYAPKDIQIGLIGKQVAPKLYIALGINGDCFHNAAIRHSKTIVAINANNKASILKYAHYFINQPWQEALPELHLLTQQFYTNSSNL